MHETIIKIPNVAKEVRIGFSFNYMIKVIEETEAVSGVALWDFADVSFLHPFFLAPLAIYKSNSSKIIKCINIPLKLQSYLNCVCFDRLLHFVDENKEDVDAVMRQYFNATYLPLCSFAMTDSNKDIFGSVIRTIIEKQTGINGSTPLSYLISELLDNVFEHSQSKNGYVFSQYLPNEDVINLCIGDLGIGIYQSFKNADLYQEEIDGSEACALRLANEGYSTKNRPDAENRGYGISTSKAMLVRGMKGAFFMLSGSAFHRYENNANDYIELGNLFRWNGTIILMRIPTKFPEGFNYIDYLE